MLRPFRGTMPTVHETAYIDLSAQVIGDVVIGEASSVWMNVVIRGDVHRIRIGDRTNVQDLTCIHVMRDTHPTLIGDDVTIGHGAVVHGCTIEDRVLIGMGAIILNGAVIGQRLDRRRRHAHRRGRRDSAAFAGDGQSRQGPPRAERRGSRLHSRLREPLRRLPARLHDAGRRARDLTTARSNDGFTRFSMASQSTKPARGMRDFLPADVRRRTYVIDVVREVYERYGFEPLETPAVENLETLMGKYGEEGNQLIFPILKRGEQFTRRWSR